MHIKLYVEPSLRSLAESNIYIRSRGTRSSWSAVFAALTVCKAVSATTTSLDRSCNRLPTRCRYTVWSSMGLLLLPGELDSEFLTLLQVGADSAALSTVKLCALDSTKLLIACSIRNGATPFLICHLYTNPIVLSGQNGLMGIVQNGRLLPDWQGLSAPLGHNIARGSNYDRH